MNMKFFTGTYTWPIYYHACAGKQQSPINIFLDEVNKVKFPALKFNNYDFPKEMILKNNGHSGMSNSNKKYPKTNLFTDIFGFLIVTS